MRLAWLCVVADGDTDWIDAQIRDAERHPGQSFTGIGEALKRLLAAGADRADLAELVRGMQVQFMHDLFFRMTFPGEGDDGTAWGVVEFSTSEDDPQPGSIVDGLHELVLDTDPTGREMRPR